MRSKAKNCVFRLINVFLSGLFSAEFVYVGERKERSILDDGLTKMMSSLGRILQKSINL